MFINFIKKEQEEGKLSMQEYLVIKQCFVNNEKSIFKTIEYINCNFYEERVKKWNDIIEKYLEGK